MYKALVSFAGIITMAQDEVKEITDKEIVKDLIKAGYIVEIKTKKSTEKVDE